MTVTVTVVGSGTLLPDDRHRSAGHLVEWSRGSLLMDCGAGVLHGLARDLIDWRRISHLVITHFHTDHIGDLAALFWAWTHGLTQEERTPRTLVGPVGMKRTLDALAAAHGDFMREPGAPLDVIEMLPGDQWEDRNSGLILRSHSVRHTAEALAYRIELEGLAVGYTGDTGPYRPLGAFFHGVDLLVSECATSDDSPVDVHLSPESVAELARAACPDRLILTHLYPEVDRRGLPDLIRSLGYLGDVRVGEDGLRIPIGRETQG